MDKEDLKKIIYIIISILIAIIAIKLVIWLLPIILIAILALFIYNKLKERNFDEVEKIKRTKNQNNSKKKKIVIIDEKDIK